MPFWLPCNAGNKAAKGGSEAAQQPTSYQICRIGTKGAVPDPALVTKQRLFKLHVIVWRNGPDLDALVG